MKPRNFNFIQKNSDEILIDGIFTLENNLSYNFYEITSPDAGNYLISNNKTNYYIGEGKNLQKRLRQQFRPETSTFFKTYQKIYGNNPLKISDFKIQTIHTKIGRKELEEFGIVNLKTSLNKFQLEKRSRFNIQQNGLWQEVQTSYEQIVSEADNIILTNKFTAWFDCDVKIISGIYIVKNKKDELIYIGESSNINERYKTHSGQTYFSALRRHIGTDILDFELQEIKGRKRYFTAKEDLEITKFLKNCNAIFYPINFGRFEIEEFMIKKYRPVLNRKENKSD